MFEKRFKKLPLPVWCRPKQSRNRSYLLLDMRIADILSEELEVLTFAPFVTASVGFTPGGNCS